MGLEGLLGCGKKLNTELSNNKFLTKENMKHTKLITIYYRKKTINLKKTIEYS